MALQWKKFACRNAVPEHKNWRKATPHNHVLNNAKVDRPQWMYAVSLVNLDGATKTVLPTEGNCKRTIRLTQKSCMSLEPNNLNRLIMSGTWRKTAKSNPQQFAIYDNGVNVSSRIIIFATDDNVRLLGNADTVISKWWVYIWMISMKSHLIICLHHSFASLR